MPGFYRRQALLLEKVIRWTKAGRAYCVRGALAIRTAQELASLGLVSLEERPPPDPESRIRYIGVRATSEGRSVWAQYSRAPARAYRHGGDRRSRSFKALAQTYQREKASGT
jgi:hypothetical protein